MAKFSGDDYDHDRDHGRLDAQIARVHAVMRDGGWRTVEEVQAVILTRYGVEDRETSISAQIRNLRKPENGEHTIRRQYVGGGLYRFRLVAKGTPAPIPESDAREPQVGLWPSDGQPRTGMM